MSFDNRGNVLPPANAPVYTVYPGCEGSTNYGFHVPPPKYEDVVSGRQTVPVSPPQPPPGTNEVVEPVGVILFTPAPPKATIAARLLSIFVLIFIMCFTTFVLIKVFSHM